MQIDDEITKGKTVGFVRIGIAALFVMFSVWAIIHMFQSYQMPAPAEETPVVCDLQPTVWKGEYLLPLPSVAVNVLADKEVGPVLRLSVALVVSHRSDVKEVYNALPAVKESIILFARGLSVEDVQSPEALYRLKQALLKRIQWVLAPVVVQDVLISELVLEGTVEDS